MSDQAWTRRAQALLTAIVLCVGSGCGSGTPPPAPSAAPPAPVTSPPPPRPTVSNLEKLTVSEQPLFEVSVPARSLAVVEHYDKLLAERGWVKKLPQKATDPGARKWISTGARVGPSDAYDAAWQEPKSGRVALLNIWQVAGEADRQHGTFEFFLKGQSPFDAP